MLVDSALNMGYSLLDKGMVPDVVLRHVIRALLRQRLREIDLGSYEAHFDAKMKWIQGVRARETIADSTDKANQQHYEIITGDVNTFDFSGNRHFHRILSIEMFEHMKNYKMLMTKVASWLRPKASAESDESLFFVHIFCHRTTPYHFEDNDGWMAQTFFTVFTGGTMPSHDLLLYFQDNLSLVQSWYINGKHYARTCEDWLKTQDSNARGSIALLEKDAEAQGLPAEEGSKTFYRFRVFYMACAELFAMDGGDQWGVGHYLFRRKD
ncbi:hypothetical protein EIP86_005089 [Pleurotus ostreatoroseus]|nr:hypothetical protein EIP86_005089 [Pleurotus ostreatoroseus]